jgi:uncharacterized membrane protein YoaK (UPF0700 family)
MAAIQEWSGAIASRPLQPEEHLQVAVLLSIAGGYLDAFTWLAHDGVLANAQTANVVLLGVYAAQGQWSQAWLHLPPIGAFVLGVAAAVHLRRYIGDAHKVVLLSLIVEITVLVTVMMLHLHLPNVAGTLGISFSAALQTTSFTRVEGSTYSSVMTTGNLRQSVVAFLAALERNGERRGFRQGIVFASLCLSFGLGAALGAVATIRLNSTALAVPITLLATTLSICALRTREAST